MIIRTATRHVRTLSIISIVSLACLALPTADTAWAKVDGPCSGFQGSAYGHCNAYCNAQNCPSHPNTQSCQNLRQLFAAETGSSVFPCDVAVTATVTATRTQPAPTSTNTAVPATSTATAVPATSTATAVPPTSTATEIPPTNTATALPETPTATATATGTAAATATDTPEVATATATATGTAAATVTDTPVPAATATDTAAPAATATDTGAPAATATSTSVPATSTNTVAAATATNTPAATDTITPTVTVPPTPTTTPIVCPLAQGRYTQTTTGGVLKVSTFQPFQFPSGGTTVQDVSAGDADCVHNTVVPYPGGLTVPVFCVPALGYTVQVTQTGCGVGVIDSNGGSDLTTTELGDTSYSSGGCAASQSCAVFADSSGEIDITVGDGTADTCSSGTANAMVSIPVHTMTWLDADGACPDADGMFDGSDTLITEFPQTLDLTTDRAIAQFADNAPTDGCSLRGAGPAGPYTTNQMCIAAGNPYACCTGSGAGTCVGNGAVGSCLDLSANTVTVAGGGTVFSSALPLHDLLFTTVQPATVGPPAAFGGATCASPPTINFSGLAQRCIIAP